MSLFRKRRDTRKRLLDTNDRFWKCLAYQEDMTFEKWDIKFRTNFTEDFLREVYLRQQDSWVYHLGQNRESFCLELLSCRDRSEAITVIKRATWIKMPNHTVDPQFS